MLAIRNLLRNNQVVKNVVQQRNMSGIAVPARNKVSKGVSKNHLFTSIYFINKVLRIKYIVYSY